MAEGSYVNLQGRLVPWYLRPYGEACGLLKDGIVRFVRSATKVGIVREAPSDGLPHLGVQRRLARGPGEAESNYRRRLEHRFDSARWAGSDKGVIDGIADFPELACTVHRNREWEGEEPGLYTMHWARMWVEIPTPVPWTSEGTWGDPGTWGDGGTWGSTMTLAEVSYLRQLVREATSSHVKVHSIIVVLSGELWGDGGTWADAGTWGGEAIYLEGW